METGGLNDVECIIMEFRNCNETIGTEQERLDALDSLEAFCGFDPSWRISSTVGSSEIDENNKALYVDWKSDKHVHCVKQMLPLKDADFGEDDAFASVTAIAQGFGAIWKLQTGERLILYAGGEGTRIKEEEVPMAKFGYEDEEEFESVKVEFIDKRQIITVVSRRLGLMPKEEEARMELLRKQQESVIRGFMIMEGLDNSNGSPMWEEHRAPRLLALSKDQENVAQAALYTLMRTTKDSVSTLDAKKLEGVQLQPKDSDGRRKVKKGEGVLTVGGVRGTTKQEVMSFEKGGDGSRPEIVWMGHHRCREGHLMQNHPPSEPCMAEVDQRTRKLTPMLQAAADLMVRRLAIPASKQCPMFNMWSIKNGELSPCPWTGGCMKTMECCSEERWVERGTALPRDVCVSIDAYKEQKRSELRMKDEQKRAEERNKRKATVEVAGEGNPPKQQRRSPRLQGAGVSTPDWLQEENGAEAEGGGGYQPPYGGRSFAAVANDGMRQPTWNGQPTWGGQPAWGGQPPPWWMQTGQATMEGYPTGGWREGGGKGAKGGKGGGGKGKSGGGKGKGGKGGKGGGGGKGGMGGKGVGTGGRGWSGGRGGESSSGAMSGGKEKMPTTVVGRSGGGSSSGAVNTPRARTEGQTRGGTEDAVAAVASQGNQFAVLAEETAAGEIAMDERMAEEAMKELSVAASVGLPLSPTQVEAQDAEVMREVEALAKVAEAQGDAAVTALAEAAEAMDTTETRTAGEMRQTAAEMGAPPKAAEAQELAGGNALTPGAMRTSRRSSPASQGSNASGSVRLSQRVAEQRLAEKKNKTFARQTGKGGAASEQKE